MTIETQHYKEQVKSLLRENQKNKEAVKKWNKWKSKADEIEQALQIKRRLEKTLEESHKSDYELKSILNEILKGEEK